MYLIIEIVLIVAVAAYAGFMTAPAYTAFLQDRELGYEGNFVQWVFDITRGI